MQKIVIISAMVTFTALTACESVDNPRKVDSTETTNRALEAIAQELASTMETSPVLRTTLLQRLAERTTGDYEVLVSDLVGLELESGRTLGQILTASGIEIPRHAHFAAPLGLQGWSADTIPVVTFVPVRPELEVDELRYFLPGGKVRTRPAHDKPKEPVAVVAINERVDMSIEQGDIEQGDIEIGTSRRALGSSSYRDRDLYSIYIRDDHESWWGGDPEIYIMCAFSSSGSATGFNIRVNLPHVNDERRTYRIDSRLVRHYLSYGAPMLCGVYEQDSTTNNSFTIGSFSFSRGNNTDDQLGSQIVNYYDPDRTRYDTGDALFVIDDSACVPQCSGRQCGSNGCGGSCGTCSSVEQTCRSGQCEWDFNCPGGFCP